MASSDKRSRQWLVETLSRPLLVAPKIALIALLAFAMQSCRPVQNIKMPTPVPTAGKPKLEVPDVETPTVISLDAVGSVTPTVVGMVTRLVPPTLTAQPTSTLGPTEMPSPTASSSPSATATQVPGIVDALDRTCPDPPPALPSYNRYYLSGQKWPQPRPELGTHFWLTKPFAGGGRLLITEWLPYGYDAGGRYLLHNGVDSAEPMGTPLLAVADGTVVVAGSDSAALYGWRCNWYGQLVVLLLDERWQGQPVYTLYGHVINVSVQPGQKVKRGEILAEVGFGGAATVPHLHFELRLGENRFGATRNPLLWLALPDSRGAIAGRLVDPEGRPWQGVAVQLYGPSTDDERKTTWTYLDDPLHLINPDEALAENFVVGDLLPGDYEIVVALQGEVYRETSTVVGGELTTVELVTRPFKTPTPSASESPYPSQ